MNHKGISINQRSKRLLIHQESIKAFKLSIEKDSFKSFHAISYRPLHNKEPSILPDFQVTLQGNIVVSVLCIGDTYRSNNFFLDPNKIEAESDYLSYYFTNTFDLYLIKTSNLRKWYYEHCLKDNLETQKILIKTATPEGKRAYLVNKNNLLEGVKEIEFVAVH